MQIFQTKTENGRQMPAGFSLIELLVAASLVAMMGLAVFSAFAGGLRIYERLESAGNVENDIFLSLEKMERDLRNTFKFSEIDFSGNGQNISFPGLIKDVDSQGNEKLSLGKISYYFNVQDKTLIREAQNYPQGDSEIEIGKVIASLVENVNFSYYYFNAEIEKYDWKDFWEGKDGLPEGVKVELTFKDNDREVKLERTALMPVFN